MTIPWMGINFCSSRFRPLNVVNFSSMTPTAASNSAKKHEISLKSVAFSVRDMCSSLFLRKNWFILSEGGFSRKSLAAILDSTKAKKNSSHDTPRASDDRFEGWFGPGVTTQNNIVNWDRLLSVWAAPLYDLFAVILFDIKTKEIRYSLGFNIHFGT